MNRLLDIPAKRIPRKCRRCNCRACWAAMGLDRERCKQCSESFCPDRGEWYECEKWLLRELQAGRVLVAEPSSR